MGVGAEGSRSGFEDPVPKSTATRRGRHEARSRSVAESGRKGDPGRIGLHRNRDDAGAILSEAPHSACTLPRTSES